MGLVAPHGDAAFAASVGPTAKICLLTLGCPCSLTLSLSLSVLPASSLLIFPGRFVLQEPAARVVGFKVEPFSVKHAFQSPSAFWTPPQELPPLSTCDKENFVDPVKFTMVS